MIDYYRELGIDRNSDICLMRGDVINKLREKLGDEVAEALKVREIIEEVPYAENIADSREVNDLLNEIDYRVAKMKYLLLDILDNDIYLEKCLEEKKLNASDLEELLDKIHEIFGLCVMTRRSYIPEIEPY